VRSASQLGVFVAVVGVAGLCAGCATTMQTAARLQLNSARIRATQVGVKVTPASADPTVSVTGVSVLRAGHRTAFAVTVRNTGRRAVDDLPISVGYTRKGRTVYLNSAEGLDYFDAHLPRIAAGRTWTWVYTAAKALPARVRTFARVSTTAAPPIPGSISQVTINVDWGTPTAGPLRVHLSNLSGIPQYQLPIFAYAIRGDRLLAAGTANVAQLSGGAKTTVRIPLLGDKTAQVSVEAAPTIFN
jgi:hypothetical protein